MTKPSSPFNAPAVCRAPLIAKVRAAQAPPCKHDEVTVGAGGVHQRHRGPVPCVVEGHGGHQGLPTAAPKHTTMPTPTPRAVRRSAAHALAEGRSGCGGEDAEEEGKKGWTQLLHKHSTGNATGEPFRTAKSVAAENTFARARHLKAFTRDGRSVGVANVGAALPSASAQFAQHKVLGGAATRRAALGGAASPTAQGAQRGSLAGPRRGPTARGTHTSSNR